MTSAPRAIGGGVLAAGAAAAAAVAAWSIFVERTRFVVRHEVLPVLQPGARELTVLHISDLHLAPWQHGKQRFVRSLRRMFEPDLVVNTGDNYGHLDALPIIRRSLDVFAGVPGVFVHGSNDYYAPVRKNPLGYLVGPSGRRPRAATIDIEALEDFFENELGWLNLNNAARAIELRGTRIELFGTGDAHRDWDRLDLLPGAIEQMREEVEWSPASDERGLAVGVTHAPYRRVLDAFAMHGAELIFAGHTHGGQVRIPGQPALVTNCDIPRAQAQGVSVWQHRRRSSLLNVSAGLGTSIYAPVRFACPPEAIVLTLTPNDIGYP